MSVLPPDIQACERDSTLGEACYFFSGDHTLFGWLHRSCGDNSGRTGLVICNPFGAEAISSHKSVRAFAAESAALGVPAMRFDYLGTGDSADGDPQVNQLDVWSSDVVAAVNELQRRTGVDRVCLLGIRLGALVATMAVAKSDAVTSLILISPIVSGKRYLRELRTVQLAGQLGAAPDDSVPQAAVNGAVEFSGFLLSSATIAALKNAHLIKQGAPPVEEMLIIDGYNLPVARRWANTLQTSTVRTKYLALPGLVEMIMTDPHNAKTSDAMLAALRDWLLSISNARAVIAKGSHEQHVGTKTLRSSPLMELAGDEPAHHLVTERPVFLLTTDPPIFGILAEPRQGENLRRGVILLNAGASYHVGTNRLYVWLARHWAKRGYWVLRVDLAGLGDSGTRRGRAEDELFPKDALDDIRAAIDFLREQHGIGEITLCGFCSGAYHSLRAAAAGLPVSRLLMVNLRNFSWKEGTDPDALGIAEVIKRTRGHRERIHSTQAWKRLLTGHVRIGRLFSMYMLRPLYAMESVLRDLARNFSIRLPHDVGRELEEIAARGIRLVFVFGRSEAGIEFLKGQGGSSIKRLGERCRVRLIDGADHNFSQSGPRAVLQEILTNELLAE